MKRGILFLGITLLAGQSSAAAEIPAACNGLTIPLCFDVLRDLETKALEKESANRAQAIATAALPSGGIPEGATSTWDAISKLFASLGLGTSESTGTSLTLNFNTDKLWGPGNPLTVRLILRKAAIFDPLLSAQSEQQRPIMRERWQKQIDDLDDVEYTVAWSRSKRNENLAQEAFSNLAATVFAASRADQDSSVNMATILQQAVEDLKKTLAARSHDTDAQALLNSINAGSESPENWALSELKKYMSPGGFDELIWAIEIAANQSARRQERYQTDFSSRDARLLALLASNEPQFRVAFTSRQRHPLVGPDVSSGSLSLELGAWTLSEAKRKCDPDAKKLDGTCLRNFLRNNAESIRRAARLALSLEFGEVRALHFEDSGATAFSLTATKRISGKLAYGQNVKLNDVTDDVITRLDLEAKYDDVSGDEQLNNRLVGTATVSQALTDGSVLTLSLVYANKPEYRGEVQRELSARLGVKWSIAK
ncbi:MAG: hypothetical protein HRF46_06190 [Acidobacteriota bacterium]|jgi:hypothetical protein